MSGSLYPAAAPILVSRRPGRRTRHPGVSEGLAQTEERPDAPTLAVVSFLEFGAVEARDQCMRCERPACRTCEQGVTQAPAPAWLIEGGLPTEGTIAHVLVSKYADHCSRYRLSAIYARSGLDLDRSTLAGWVGKALFHLRLVADRLAAHLKHSSKLFMDETQAAVPDPGRGRTKTGWLWALARDDRAWGGPDPAGVVYFYAPGRGGEYAEKFLKGFDGILQVDGYASYNRLTR